MFQELWLLLNDCTVTHDISFVKGGDCETKQY